MFSPVDVFELMTVVDAIPLQWPQYIRTNSKLYQKEDFDLKKQTLVYPMGQAKLPLEEFVRNLLQKSQPLKYLYTEIVTNDHLELNEICQLPFLNK